MVEDDEVPGTHLQSAKPGHIVLRRVAVDAVRSLTSLPVVSLAIDGVQMLAAFEPNDQEHARRSALGFGAVTSTALLHGLWLLPSGVPVPIDEVPDHKRRCLEAAGQLVKVADGCFERIYSPPGAIRVVAFGGKRTSRSLHQAARFTPIVQRLALAKGPVHPSASTLRSAEVLGVGLVECVDGTTNVLVTPSVPELGVPAVYRWWIAELAYSSWLYENAQPVS